MQSIILRFLCDWRKLTRKRIVFERDKDKQVCLRRGILLGDEETGMSAFPDHPITARRPLLKLQETALLIVGRSATVSLHFLIHIVF